MSLEKHIAHRVKKAQLAPIPDNPVDRSRLLKSCQVTLSKLESSKALNEQIIKDAQNELIGINANIALIQNKLSELEDFGTETKITEHALLRYLERFEGIDLKEIYNKICDLPAKDKTTMGNTIVTVFPTPDDCMNLAGNEKTP